MMDTLQFAPGVLVAWMRDRDKLTARLQENREFAREVSAKLIEDKKQELKNGTSRKDLLSLLG